MASGSRRSTSRSRSTGSSRRKSAPARPAISPATVRSILGIVLIVAGAVILAALLLPTDGILAGLADGILDPLFGEGAWLLGVLLVVGGVMVERTPEMEPAWILSAAGALLIFLGGEGLIHLLSGGGGSEQALADGGGAVGAGISGFLSGIISSIGAFIVLVGIVLGGFVLLFDLTLGQIATPVVVAGRLGAAGVALTAEAVGSARADRAARRTGATPALPVRRTPSPRPTAATAAAGLTESVPELPRPVPSPAPISQTVWAGGGETARPAPIPAPAGTPVTAAPGASSGTAAPGADPEAPTSWRVPREWSLPPVELLVRAAAPTLTGRPDHERNIRIIEEKLRSFQIPAEVVATNSGPVVTQYEVKPDVRIKLSRIEGLADDLAMALAARSIRIEAPIPGKDVVGIEIPNHTSDVVGLRDLYDDARMGEATSKLTFALGRDVSGRAYAVDLGRMPHLLIAGATGSGKSVCVNALITSIIMRATPDEVSLVLVDLKRVELAPYQGIPHLRTEVIMEPNEARAALAWAVGQMEDRYKLLAGKGERNIAAYNASDRVAPEDRLPYIVLVIDELADLMMREGRKVEEPIVKLAQKARAVGMHLVLATQRPSVNVVTGLIKANVPSRIAFAMASNVDSRTVLDQPGAEDLIGRGDMLYQPADLPRPVRLQGVFVSDAEVRAIADHWRAQEPEPRYDPAVLAGSDEESGESGEFAWLAKLAEDEMTPRAAELVLATGKASTSMMQTKLKVGFNRASRLIEELEKFGIVGPQDPRNPATPRAVYGPENWVRGAADMDDL